MIRHYFLTDKASSLNQYGKHELVVIPDEQMRTLQNMLSQDDCMVHFATYGFALGDKVKVIGWGDDVEGYIVRIPDDKAHYVGVRIDKLGCAYMEISPKKLLKQTK